MAQYTKEQLQQFLDDNQEIFTLAKNAGVKPEQIPEDALNMSAFDASWSETIKSGLANAGRNLVKQGYGIARSVVEGVAEPEQDVEFMGKTYSPQQLGSSFGNVVRAVVGQEALEETASKLATADANVSDNIAANTPFNSDLDSFKATSYNAISGVVPSLATGITAAVLTRNPMAAGAAVGGGAYGTYYGEGRDERDLTPEEARNRATTLAALEGATSAIPFSKFLNTGGATGLQGMLSRVGGAALTEGAQEGFMTYAGAGYDKAIHDIALPEDLSTQAWRGFKAGALGGGVMGAGGYMMNPNPQVEQETNVNPDSVDLQQPEPQPNLDEPAYLRTGEQAVPTEPEIIDQSNLDEPAYLRRQQEQAVSTEPEVVTEPVVEDNQEGIDQVEEIAAPTTESELVTDAEPVVQTPVEGAPQVDEQPQPEQPKVEVDREQVYQNALKDFSEIAQQKNKSRQKELILAANKYLGTPKNPPKKGGKAALLNRIRETAKAHQSLQGATAESLKERFPTNKELIAFRKKHGIKSRATNKDALIKSILDWRDKPRANVEGRLNKKATHNKLLADQKENKPISLDELNSLNSGFTSVYQTGDVLLAQAKGEKFVPSPKEQGEDYKQASEMMDNFESEESSILESLTDEQVTHYAQRYIDISNPDIEYLEAISLMESLGYPKEIARAVGKYAQFEIRNGVFEQMEKRGIKRPEESWKKKQKEREQQKQSDTDKLNIIPPDEFEEKPQTLAEKYPTQEALEEAAFEAGKSNPNKSVVSAFQDTGFHSFREAELAGFDARALSNTTQKGQKVTQGDVLEGKEHTVYTPDNEPIETKVKIVNVGQLKASHTIEGVPESDYPPYLQPRDRTRPALVNKTKQMSKNLNPKRLDLSSDIATGAPIVNNGVVESGNGRTIAIKQAYRNGMGDKYKQHLIDNADKYGVDPKAIEAMEQPMLVLERQGEMTAKERAEFTKKANRDVGSSMSPVEQAKSDAKLLSDDDLLEINIGDTGDMNAGSNHKFLARFVERIGDEAAAQYIGENGRWNSDLGKRALAAVFQKAYGDTSLTSNVFEDTNQDTKRVMTALAKASGHIAKLKAEKDGDLGLGKAVGEAANLVRAAGAKGQTAKEYLTQLDMLDKPSDVGMQIAELFANNATSAKRMSDALISLTKQIDAENVKSKSGSLFGDESASLPELIKVNEKFAPPPNQEAQTTGDMFGTNAPKLEAPPSKMSVARIGEIATANDRLGRIKQLIEKGYSKENAIKLNNRLEVQRKRELEHKRGQDAIQRKPEPTLEPLAEQDKSPALDDVIIQLSGKSSPAYLAARKLANNIKNMMYEGVSFNDAYNHFRKLNPSGISTFDRAYKNLTGRTPTQALLDPRKEKSLDQIKTIGDAIFNIKSGRDMAHWLSKHATSPVNRRIAERIAPLLSADLRIKSVGYRSGSKPPKGMGKRHGWYLKERFESGKVDERIILWNKGEKLASTEEVVTHELIHAATSLAIANAKKADPKSEIAKVVKELDSIRQEAFKNYLERKTKRKLTDTEKSKEGKFAISKGLNNQNSEDVIDEFVAWGITNPELQDILKSIKLKPKKSAWSEFVNAIGKLFGLKPTDNTALGRLLETTDKLLTLTEAEQAAQTRSLGHDVNVGTPVTQQEINDFRHKLDPDSAKLPLKDKIVQESKALAEKGFGTATSNVLSKMRQGIVDKYEPLRKLDEALHGDNILSNTLSRAWVLAKSANAAQGALHAMLEYGRIRYNKGQKIIETVSDKNSGGLKKVLSQLDEKNELEDFFYWIAANRANDINERSKAAEAEIRNLKAEKKLLLEMRHEADSRLTRNKVEKAIKDTDSKINELKKVADVKERFMSERDIEVGMSLNSLQREDGSSREALFEKVHNEFNEYRADILKIAEATGVISSENRAMWENEFYVPFYRVLGDSEQSGSHPSIGLSRQDVIKKLKGSEKQLGNLLDNTLMNFHYLLNASLKNRAAFQALENAESFGIARKVSEHKRDKDTSTYVMVEGKKQWYEVDDPNYLGALMSMSNMQLPDGFRQIAQAGSGLKVFFTKWTTAVPDFIVKNFIRDTLLAPALSNVGWKEGGTLRGAKLWGLGEMSRIQADMLASGGAFEFGFSRDEVKNTLSADMKKKVVRAEDALGMFGKGVNSYQQVQNLAENANRAAIYAANLDKGKLVASFEAMDLMDFGAGGSWAGIRLLNSLVPFLNATLQGLDKTARAGETVWNTMRGRASPETRAQAMKFATYTASLAVATVGMALQNADDEEYQQLPDYAKNMYWYIRTGGEKGQYILVAKPQGIGFPLNVAERMTDAFTGAIKTKDILDYVKTTMFDTLMLNPTPQVAKPIAELYMNRNMFTGQAIESSHDERFSKSERFDYRTSEVAKLLGNDIISPKQIDHLIQGYFSSFGQIISGGINFAVDQLTENDRPQTHLYEQRFNPARVLFKDLSSPSFTRSQQYFYDIYSEFSQAKNDYKRAVEMGDQIKASEILNKGKVKISLVPMLDKYKRKVTQINKSIDAVRSDKRLSAEEKRNYIDAYNKLKAQTYKQVTDRVDDILDMYN